MTDERDIVNRREDFKRFIVFCLASLVVIAQTAVFAYIWYDYYRGLIFEPFWRKGNWVLIAIYGLINVLFSRLYGGLKVGYLKRIDVFYSLTLATICTNIVTYFQITLINRWFLKPWPMVEMTLIQFVIILVWIWGSRYIYSKLYQARKLLVIYGDRDPGDLIRNLRTEIAPDRMCKTMFQITVTDIRRKIPYDHSIIFLHHPINFFLTHTDMNFSADIIFITSGIHLFDTPLLVAKNMGLSIEQRAAKRLLDIIISGIGIIVASPLMLIIALCVKFYDRGPVLYRQERLTEGGRPFKICKFRSMCVDSEKNGARLASKHDSRITPVGRVLRNLHLDELPQLFNVFMGDMSLVGPRPERQTLVREYCKEIPEFYYRLKVKAGLTGYAQVYGKYNTTPYDKLKLDLFYIENYSFVLDLKLLMMTVKIFFQKEVSEGVNEIRQMH